MSEKRTNAYGEKPFWLSKKWLLAVAGAITAILMKLLPESPLTTTEILMPVVAYIIGQGLADFGKHRNDAAAK